MIAKERLNCIFSHYGLNAKSFSEKIGLGRPQAIYDILNDKTKSITENLSIKIISVFPEINKVWLLTGEGDMLREMEERKRIPLYEVSTVGGYKDIVANPDTSPHDVLEWIDAGDWFPEATAAIHHYGDSMVEYPSGCILALRLVEDWNLIVNGRNYVIETDEFRITKQLQYDGGEYILAYSSNRDTYPDGRIIHAPIRIALSSIRRIYLVLGSVVKEYSNCAIPIK